MKNRVGEVQESDFFSREQMLQGDLARALVAIHRAMMYTLRIAPGAIGKNKESREGGLTALEGDLRKALGRSFLRWEKDHVKGTTASVGTALSTSRRKL